MKFFVSLIMVLVLASNVFAAVEINTQGLTEKQKAELVTQIEDLKTKAKEAAAVPTVERANQWVEVGRNAGLALASCAKEVGIAGDAFLNSYTGKVVFSVLIFKMIGGPLIHFAAGVLILGICIPIWIWSYRKNIDVTLSYDAEGKVIKKEVGKIDTDVQTAYFFSGVVIFVAALVTIFTF